MKRFSLILVDESLFHDLNLNHKDVIKKNFNKLSMIKK